MSALSVPACMKRFTASAMATLASLSLLGLSTAAASVPQPQDNPASESSSTQAVGEGQFGSQSDDGLQSGDSDGGASGGGTQNPDAGTPPEDVTGGDAPQSDGDEAELDEDVVAVPLDEDVVAVPLDEDGVEVQSSEAVPFAGSAQGCSYADPGTGTYASTLCWLNMENVTAAYTFNETVNCTGWLVTTCSASGTYTSVRGSQYGHSTGTGFASAAFWNETNARNNAYAAARVSAGVWSPTAGATTTGYGPLKDFPIEVKLSDTFTLKANVSISSSGSGLAIDSKGFPTWESSTNCNDNGAFLGRCNFYTGVTGKPALNQSQNAGGNDTTIKLDQIKVVNQSDAAVGGFSIVVADAESTDNGESIEWSYGNTNSSGFLWLPNNPTAWANATGNSARKTAAVGNAYPGTDVNNWPQDSASTAYRTGTVTVKSTSDPGKKTGTGMLQIAPTNANTNFTVTQVMKGQSKQAVAFGVMLAGARVNVKVDDRILNSSGVASTTDFKASISTTSYGTTTTATGPTELSAQGSEQVYPLGVSGTIPVTFAEKTTADDFTPSYKKSWQCFKTQAGKTTQEPWSGNGGENPPGTEWTTLTGNQFVECTVTYKPPYLTLLKAVDQAQTAATNTADQWTLTATGATSKVSVPGSETAVATSKRAIAVTPTGGNPYALTEAGPTGTSPAPWPHGYDWTDISCKTQGGAALEPGVFTSTKSDDIVTSASLKIAKSDNIVCTYKNTAVEPKLELEKSADPVSGTTLSQNQFVTYKLTFGNSGGTTKAIINHVDHLKDLLDDADFVANSVRIGDGTETVYPVASISTPGIAVAETLTGDSPNLTITGDVPRNATRTVWFQVQVKTNLTDTDSRQSETAPLKGYELRNYLTEAEDSEGKPVVPPATCTEPAAGQKAACTSHPILAWKTTKMSQPLDGAALSVGGDLHYQIRVERINPDAEGNIEDIVVSDDLTQTFRFARWFPAAPVPSPAKQRGIYFYNSDGSGFIPTENQEGSGPHTNRLPNLQNAGGGGAASPDDIAAANAYVPAPVFTPNTTIECPGPGNIESTQGPHNPDCFMGTWKLTTAQFTLPTGAAYADVWFSVRIGFPSQSDDSTKIIWNDQSGFCGSAGATGCGDWDSSWKNYWQPYRQASTGDFFYNVAGAANAAESPAGESVSCSNATLSQDYVFNPAGQALYPQVTGVNGNGTDFTLGDSAAIYPVRPTDAPQDIRLPNPDPTKEPANVPDSCMVKQKVDENYFVIRKDLLFRNDSGQLDRAINMVGHHLTLEMQIGEALVPIENVCVSDAGGSPTYSAGTTALTCTSPAEPLMCTGWDEPGVTPEQGATCALFRPIASGAQAGRYRADRLPEATYFLTETKVPTAYRTGPGAWNSTDNTTPLPGAQLLAEKVKFEVTAESGRLIVPTDSGSQPACQIPYGGNVSDLPTACINPTGFVMVLTNVTGPRLPFTGGQWASVVAVGGALLLTITMGGVALWRRRQVNVPATDGSVRI